MLLWSLLKQLKTTLGTRTMLQLNQSQDQKELQATR